MENKTSLENILKISLPVFVLTGVGMGFLAYGIYKNRKPAEEKYLHSQKDLERMREEEGAGYEETYA